MDKSTGKNGISFLNFVLITLLVKKKIWSFSFYSPFPLPFLSFLLTPFWKKKSIYSSIVSTLCLFAAFTIKIHKNNTCLLLLKKIGCQMCDKHIFNHFILPYFDAKYLLFWCKMFIFLCCTNFILYFHLFSYQLTMF